MITYVVEETLHCLKNSFSLDRIKFRLSHFFFICCIKSPVFFWRKGKRGFVYIVNVTEVSFYFAEWWWRQCFMYRATDWPIRACLRMRHCFIRDVSTNLIGSGNTSFATSFHHFPALLAKQPYTGKGKVYPSKAAAVKVCRKSHLFEQRSCHFSSVLLCNRDNRLELIQWVEPDGQG